MRENENVLKKPENREKSRGTGQSETMEQFRAMARLELCNIFGLNVLRHTKDPKAKRKSSGLFCLYVFLLAVTAFYVGGLVYGLVFLGMDEVVFAYLIAISSVIIFVFGVLKAGSVLFRREGYDMACALPVPTAAVVFARILRMYVENLGFSLVVLLPGTIVYAWNVRPGAAFYLALWLGMLSVPMIPMAGAVLVGVLVTGASSRMRHKSLVAAGLSILLVLGIFWLTSRMSALEGALDLEMLKNVSAFVFLMLGRLYAPAVWLGKAVVYGDVLHCLMCVGLSLAIFAVVSAGVCACFHPICRNLYGGFARHDYKVEELGGLKGKSVLVSLCCREFRRYFASSIYVANTIIGPIMGCVISGMLLFFGMDSLEAYIPFPIDSGSLAPFLLGGVFCMMTATSTSISMEGKNWWIVKSLPLSAKHILDAKILMNLLLVLPFYLAAEVMLFLAVRPGIMEALWTLLIPAVTIVFSCVYGITVNLHFPVLNWESEVSVVKQSASAVLGGIGGFILAILCLLAAMVVPKEYADVLRLGLCVVLILVTAVLYKGNNRNAMAWE